MERRLSQIPRNGHLLIRRTIVAMRAARLKTAGAFLWRHNGAVALIEFAAVGLAALDDYARRRTNGLSG